MGQYPITSGNIALIVMGIALVISGPIITYRTYKTMKRLRAENPGGPLGDVHPISNGINFLIAAALSWAGTLFIINNLRGSYFG